MSYAEVTILVSCTVELVFLGCGGGRYQTIDQHFKTGGFRLHGQVKLHVDPGPGALLLTHQLGLNPLDLDCIIVTHCHPDHYADAEILTEAMTQHMTKRRGVLIGSSAVLRGGTKFGPAISKYHQEKVPEIVTFKPGVKYELRDLKLEATRTHHSEPTAFGLKVHSSAGAIGYTSDTQYFEGLAKQFEGCRVLIASITRPLGMRISWHLCSDDLISILKDVKPELAVIVHMGMLFLRHHPDNEAARIKAETGVDTVPGYAGTRIDIDKEINVKRPARQPSLESFVEFPDTKFIRAE
jgi:phosphoribosyl 1,2-cyclic phosphodiesterase